MNAYYFAACAPGRVQAARISGGSGEPGFTARPETDDCASLTAVAAPLGHGVLSYSHVRSLLSLPVCRLPGLSVARAAQSTVARNAESLGQELRIHGYRRAWGALAWPALVPGTRVLHASVVACLYSTCTKA